MTQEWSYSRKESESHLPVNRSLGAKYYYDLGVKIFKLAAMPKKSKDLGLAKGTDHVIVGNEVKAWGSVAWKRITDHGEAEYRVVRIHERDFGLITNTPLPRERQKPPKDIVDLFVFGDGEIIKGMRRIVRGFPELQSQRDSRASLLAARSTPGAMRIYLLPGENDIPLTNPPFEMQFGTFQEIIGTIIENK